MPKKIFTKLLLIFIIVLTISFSITGTMLYLFLGNFVAQEKVNALLQSGEKINEFLHIYVENINNRLTRRLFINVLNSYSESTNSIIWVVSPDGEIVMRSATAIPKSVNDKIRSTPNTLRLPNEEQYLPYMTTNQYYIEKGDFVGLFKETEVSWLTIIMPFKYIHENYEENVLAAVYLSTPIPEVQKAQRTVFNFFIFSAIISVLISIIVIYIFSLKISTPLKKINTAAKEIAGGEFNKRLKIKTKDEIGELAQSFNNMANDLENLEKMRRDFIANVSHELRTPMTSIRGFIEGVLDGTIEQEKQLKYLNIVNEEIKRLNRLVNDLLDLARIESGELNLKIKPFNINEIIRKSIIKFEKKIIYKNLQIEALLDSEELIVIGDCDAIERVIINLLDNAIKFTPTNGKIIVETSKNKEKIYISISDTGIGISKDDLELIWSRFYKSDKSRSKEKGGTGLGLSIVKSIVLEHNQSIWVESELDKGTKFTFTLKEYNS